MEQEPQLTYAALAATLELSRVRSLFMVGAALVATFPIDEEWWKFVEDPETIESLNALALVVNDMRLDVQMQNAQTPEDVTDAAGSHHERAMETIELLAERIGVAPDDLLNVLASA